MGAGIADMTALISGLLLCLCGCSLGLVIPFESCSDRQRYMDAEGKQFLTIPVTPTQILERYVFCEDGWQVIQRRVDGSLSFDRTWDEYMKGFGDLYGEYFFGLSDLHYEIRRVDHKLKIELESKSGEKAVAYYDLFVVDANYAIILGNYNGTAGDSLTPSQPLDGLDDPVSDLNINNTRFSSRDRDNDNWDKNCADVWGGGWWHNACFAGNLNGPYNTASFVWYTWKKWEPLAKATMYIRPVRDLWEKDED